MTGLLRQSAYPNMIELKNNNDYTICQSNTTYLPSNCKLRVEYPMPNTWYYVGITSDCPYTVLVELKPSCYEPNSALTQSFLFPELVLFSKSSSSSQDCQSISPPVKTFRFKGPTYFSVKYYFNSNYNRSNAVLIQKDRKPYFIEFLVDTDNNGGTLSLELRNLLIQDANYRATTSAATTTTTTTFGEGLNFISNASSLFNNYTRSQRSNSNFDIKQVVKVCLLYNSMSLYNKCPEGYELSTQSYPNNIQTQLLLNVAYPMIGTWYLAIWRECYKTITK